MARLHTETLIVDPAPMSHPQDRKRGRINDFVDRHLLLWEGAMAIATIAYVALTFLSEAHRGDIPAIYMLAFPILFVGEFGIRLVDSRDRRTYVRHHWIDAVTAIPLLGALRALRLLRLLRVLGIVRLITTVDHATGHSKRERTSFWFLGPLLVFGWVGSAYALWVLESPSNPGMHTFGDALYMAFGAATTFGFENVKPVTTEGKVIAGILILVGVGLVSFASAQVTAKLLHPSDPMGSVPDRLSAIEKSLEEIKAIRTPAAARSLGTPGGLQVGPTAGGLTGLQDEMRSLRHLIEVSHPAEIAGVSAVVGEGS
jgi:voltage-gated potassium channel